MAKHSVIQLLPVQEIDNRIFRLRQDVAAKPARLAEFEKRVAASRGTVEAAGEASKKIKLEAAEHEFKIKAFDEQIEKLQGNVKQVRKNDEYQTLMKEINSVKADKAVVEDALLEKWTALEHHEAALKDKKGELAAFEGEYNREKAKVEGEVAELQKKLAGEDERRRGLLTGIDAELLQLYERILNAKNDGRALAKIEAVASTDEEEADSFVCGGCRINLTLQDANLVYVGREPVPCKNCSRLLYVETAEIQSQVAGPKT